MLVYEARRTRGYSIAFHDDLDVFKLLVELGADKNIAWFPARFKGDIACGTGECPATMLMCAAKTANTEMLGYLLEKEADVNAQCPSGHRGLASSNGRCSRVGGKTRSRLGVSRRDACHE